MFCRHCGTKNIENSAFCESCGAKLISPQGDLQSNRQYERQGNRQPRRPEIKPSKVPFVIGLSLVLIIGIVALFFMFRGGSEDIVYGDGQGEQQIETETPFTPDTTAHETAVSQSLPLSEFLNQDEPLILYSVRDIHRETNPTILIFENGKLTRLRSPLTLGELSNMSDNDIIELMRNMNSNDGDELRDVHNVEFITNIILNASGNSTTSQSIFFPWINTLGHFEINSATGERHAIFDTEYLAFPTNGHRNHLLFRIQNEIQSMPFIFDTNKNDNTLVEQSRESIAEMLNVHAEPQAHED